MIQRTPLICALALGTLAAGMLVGCNGETGAIWWPKRYPESSAQFRTEFEVIPNAELVRVDTMPQWELGRHAYRRGADRLLVMTRITSWAPPLEQDWTTFNYKEPKGPRTITDREMERAWITIPYGTPVGQRLVGEELEARFLTGYDRNQATGEAYYILPHKMLGTITIVEEKPDELVVDLNMEIRPKDNKNWHLKQQMRVPITLEGKHAQKATDSDQLIIAGIRRRPSDTDPGLPPIEPFVSADVPKDDDGGAGLVPGVKPDDAAQTTLDAGGPKRPPAATDDNPADPDSSTTDPATADQNGEAGDGDEKKVVTEVAGKSILGQWFVNTNRVAFYFQFNEDGTYGMASAQDDHPVIRTLGTFEVRSGYILFRALKRFRGAADHSAEIRSRITLLRASWLDEKLILDGNISSMAVHLRTYKKDFPDLAAASPPAAREAAGVDDKPTVRPTVAGQAGLR